MSAHLRSEEYVEHLDGHLAADRERHLQKCAECTARLKEWETLASAIQDAGVIPEPSPLFWDYFSERVQEATASEPVGRPAWWRRTWVQIGATASVAVVIAVAMYLRSPAPSKVVESPVAEEAFTVDPASWQFVTDLASSVPFEELRQEASPSPAATDDMVAQLTPAQRAELVRLVKLEKGISE